MLVVVVVLMPDVLGLINYRLPVKMTSLFISTHLAIIPDYILLILLKLIRAAIEKSHLKLL